MQQKNKRSRSLPLNLILIAPFVVQIVAAIGITGWLSYQNGQRTVSDLATGLLVQAKLRVKERLDGLLDRSEAVVQSNTFAYQQGHISLDREADLQKYFWEQVRRNRSYQRAFFVGDEKGRFLSVRSDNTMTAIENLETQQRVLYSLDSQGNRQQPLKRIRYDPRQRNWYKQALLELKPIWTEPYLFASGVLGITTAEAIRNPSGQVIAVSGIDLSLDDFDAYLQSIQPSPSSQLFVIERSGRLVAASHKPSNVNAPNDTAPLQRILATDTNNPIMRESTRYLLSTEGNLKQVNESLTVELFIQNDRYFLSVLPYRFNENLDWLVLTVVSEKDFSRQIQENNRTTFLLCGISLFVAIAIGMLTSRSLTRTIARLTKATDEVAQGNWQLPVVSNGGSKEMNTLVDSFDSMVERLQEVFGKLENFAYVDALTGLPNRAAFLVSLQQAIATAKHSTPQSFAVLLIELYSFKLIENSLGPAIGDLLLKSVATRLQECLQVNENSAVYISRLERDEFAILVKDIAEASSAVTTAQNILQAFQQPFRLGQQDILAEAIVGVVVDPEQFNLPEEILRNVNLAKFSAKAQGKQRYVVFDGLMRIETTERLQLAANLQYAIARNELELWYQPIITLDPGRIASFEALVRWKHPTLGLVSPLKFIPIAEETGTIVSIGEWILRTACLQKLMWNEQSPTLQAVQISVNVSAQQLLSPDFADRVEQILQETGLEGHHIQLEITESAAVSQPATIGQMLKRIQALGMKICIDDFGTGYSHLSHLLQLPIDILKIDRSFVGEIGVNPKNAEIAKTILALTKSLGIEAIAEGVETSGQLEHLRSLNCLKFQGYLFSPPIPADRVLSFHPTIPGLKS
ncbi:EAL domain-containing protein [Pseudanabaena sp. PCC 6802]|uniref:bifunctional diguanylate cyclase/phosphodiesterase n=1 Tax=Pseudanabaena sp. PCC 6802 TaxID=118173 RepID=UPI00034B3EC3|nr:EAL domain-containing protein [Pseudanabaena sp. PCC 6802]